MKISALLVGSALFAGLAQSQEMDLQVELTGPLSTQTSHKGDRVSARVMAPDALKGDTLEGKVTEVRSGGKIRGTSVLNFSFETLQHGGTAVPVATQIRSVTNSKGQVDVDEEGRAIRKTNNVGKAAGGAAIGGLIGGLAGGLKGAAIGAGAGAVVAVVLIEVAAEGPSIRFDPGSKVALSAKARSGPELASLEGNPAAAPAAVPAAPAPVPASAAAPAAAAPAPAPAQAASSSAGAQPNLTALKDDFIPGEKVLFYDDFTDMAGDEPPPHWKVRGGAMALKTGGGIRQLTTTGDKTYLTPNMKTFPKNFTVETEFKFENPGDLRSIWLFFPKDSDNEELRLWLQSHGSGLVINVKTSKETVGEAEPEIDFSQPIKEALWVQNGRLRFYINGQKVVDANQIELPPLETAQIYAELYGGDNAAAGYRMVRIAESTPDFSQMISSSGRYVTHGILFDTDSDRLKTESAAVIKSIARGLETNPNLKLRIEGHTDSTGAADHNLDLSKRRAEAVKAVLVSQFSVDASRLSTDGLGAGKPLDSNDTPQGRAQNRRVEFVKQ